MIACWAGVNNCVSWRWASTSSVRAFSRALRTAAIFSSTSALVCFGSSRTAFKSACALPDRRARSQFTVDGAAGGGDFLQLRADHFPFFVGGADLLLHVVRFAERAETAGRTEAHFGRRPAWRSSWRRSTGRIAATRRTESGRAESAFAGLHVLERLHLILAEDLGELGVNVFLKFAELLLLVGIQLQHVLQKAGENLPRPRRLKRLKPAAGLLAGLGVSHRCAKQDRRHGEHEKTLEHGLTPTNSSGYWGRYSERMMKRRLRIAGLTGGQASRAA